MSEDSPETTERTDAGEEPRPDPGEADPAATEETTTEETVPAEEPETVAGPGEAPEETPRDEEVAPPPEESAGVAVEEAVEALSPEPPEPEEPVEVPEDAVAVEDPAPSLEEQAEAEGVSTLDVEEPPAERIVEEEPAPVEVPEAEEAAAVEVPEAEEPAAPEQPEAEEAPPPAEEPPAEQPEEPAVAVSSDPFSGAGDWYVIHTYAGYENKVKTNLESRINTMQMQDKIFDVVIPMEDVMEIKGGRKQVVQKKVFPGYLLVKMTYDDDSWYVVRNTPGVTGFVSSGTGQKPTPLSRREVEKILAVKKEEVKPTFRLDFEEGDVVRIISGPFADFNGTIDEINVDQSKVKVLVNIFDRETPVELSFDQVARV